MATDNSLDWLPAGWTMRKISSDYGRKVKCFVEPSTGRKFYSKSKVLQHVENAKSDTSPKKATSSVDNAVNKASESLDWLPAGWTVEEKTRHSGHSAGRKFKCFVEPLTGRKFYSKAEVLQHLEKAKSDTSPKKAISSIDKAVNKASESPNWLPAGWTVEEKTRHSGHSAGMKFKVYIDPASGCKFYSKPEVSRYLEKINSSSSPKTGTGSANHSLDQSTESGLLLKPDVSQNCQMNESNSDHKKLHGGEDMMDNGTFERVTDEKFPPGWIKETRIRSGSVKLSDQFYMDPVSGYTFRSKVDALRYLETGDIKSCKCKPFKRDNNDLNLVNNNIRHGIDHSTRRKNLSKPEVSPDCKTSQTTVSGDRSITKQSANNGLVGKNSSEEIPPGWIMEYRTRNVANRTVKDPYYVDPVSGYEFRSKLDVQRYLETGDIRSCKIKPKKRDANDLMTDENISPSSAAEVKKAATTKRRQISEFSGAVETRDDTIVSKNIASPEVGRSLRKRKNVSDTTVNLSSPSVDIFKDSPAKASNLKHKGSKKEQTVNLSGANDIIFSVVNDILQEENESGDEHSREETQSSTKSKKKRVLNSGNEHSRDETQSSTRSKKKTVLNPPLRSSKRLAGSKLEKPLESSMGKFQAVSGNGDKIEGNSLSHTSLNGAACKIPHHLQTQAGDEVAAHTSILKDTMSRNELSNGSGKTLADQSVTDNQRGAKATKKHHGIRPQKLFAQNAFASGEMNSDVEKINRKGKGHVEVDLQDQLERQEVEKQNDGRPESKQSPVEFSYLEDPCFEFAFKTLTGAIPVENMSFQDYFKQQANASQNQNSVVEQQETVLPSFTPNPSQSAAAATPVPLQQFPPDTTSPMPLQQLPPDATTSGNISSPNFTHTGHQFGLAAGCQTKTN